MRVAVASLMYESNSFAPGTTGIETFRSVAFADGAEVLTIGDGLDSIAGAAAEAEELGLELVPTTLAIGIGGPLVAAGTFALLERRVLDGLESAGEFDGIYLQLHGAMVCEDEPDAEGALLRAIRARFGVPIAVSLDLHAHVTARMLAATPLIAGFHTLPHVDMRETGARALRMLAAVLRGATPVAAWCKIPMLTSAEGQDTNVPPVDALFELVRATAAQPGVLDASLFMAQPWLDVTEHGWTALVVADADTAAAASGAERIAAAAWAVRHQVLAPKLSIPDAVARAAAAAFDPALGPFVLADGADSVSAGCPGDGPELAAALALADLPGPAFAILTDEPAVRACERAGVGAKLQLQVGATIAPGFHQPIELEVEVETLSAGRYTSLYPPAPMDLDGVAVVRSGSLHLVLTAGRACQLDYELYLSVGLDPRQAHVVAVKSAGGYRAYFEPIARECIDVESAGPSDSRLERLPFRNLGRPMFPFDPDLEWDAVATVVH